MQEKSEIIKCDNNESCILNNSKLSLSITYLYQWVV